MDEDVKDDLKEHLLIEQGGLCCYCMQRINKENILHVPHLTLSPLLIGIWQSGYIQSPSLVLTKLWGIL